MKDFEPLCAFAPMNLKLYWQIAKNTWDETVTYRTSFILYRLREFLQILSIYFIWAVVVPSNGDFFGYTRSSILTYVLVTAFVSDIVMATRTTQIAAEINEGALTNYLVRPIHYLKYHFARDLGDKAMNIIFSIIELSLIIFLLRPPLQLQTQPMNLLLFVFAVLLAVVLFFFISVLISFIGFWSNEGWGPRFIFYQMITFFSGYLFPLDLLPKPVYDFFSLLPFTYLIFFPVKIYLGQMGMFDIVLGFIIMIFWIFVLYKFTTFVWVKGLRVYTAQGR